MTRPYLFLAALLLVSCASGSSSSERPSVELSQTSGVVNLQQAHRDPLGIGNQSSAPVEYRLAITNPFDHAVTLTSVELESVGGSGAYSMKRVRHEFSTVIPARSSTAIDLRAWVQPLQLTDGGAVTSPVLLRGMARFDSNGGTVKTGFTARLGSQRQSPAWP